MRQASRCRMQRVRNAQFHSRLYSARPLARQLTGEYRCRLVMGDKLPPGEKSVVPGPLSYCYFEARLGILTVTEQGEGP